MRARLFRYADRIRSSFWFIPVVMSAGAVALAFLSVAIDAPVTGWFRSVWGWSFTGGAEGASTVLGTVAGSAITIAGVVFSMTLVALSLTSSQFGPLLLRNFMRDSTTQVVLGTFVATFLYCLLVLRTIRRAEEVAFIPHLSVTLGVVLAVVSVGVLIYFIHHVSTSIQASQIVARVGTELREGIDRLFPQRIEAETTAMSAPPPDAGFLDLFDRESCPVAAAEDGYLQFVAWGDLMELAEREDVVIRLERRPGDYVVAGVPLARAWPPGRVSDGLPPRVNAAFVQGRERTPDQDIHFAVNQLVEIAIRALSPGVNDPFTAVGCIDYLGSALCRLAQRATPSPYRHDGRGRLRMIVPAITFPEVTDAAFNQIRQYGRSSVTVTIRLLETIAVCATFTERPQDRAALLRHAGMVARGARDGLPEDEDRRKVEECFQAASLALCGASPQGSSLRTPGSGQGV